MDWGVVVLVSVLAAKGAWRGFFREAFGLLALLGGVGAALVVGAAATRELARQSGMEEPWAGILAHGLLFLIPYVACQGIGFLLNRLGRAVFLGSLDRVAGAAFGVGAGLLLSGGGVLTLGRFGFAERLVEGSRLAAPLGQLARWGVDLVQRLLS